MASLADANILAVTVSACPTDATQRGVFADALQELGHCQTADYLRTDGGEDAARLVHAMCDQLGRMPDVYAFVTVVVFYIPMQDRKRNRKRDRNRRLRADWEKLVMGGDANAAKPQGIITAPASGIVPLGSLTVNAVLQHLADEPLNEPELIGVPRVPKVPQCDCDVCYGTGKISGPLITPEHNTCGFCYPPGVLLCGRCETTGTQQIRSGSNTRIRRRCPHCEGRGYNLPSDAPAG